MLDTYTRGNVRRLSPEAPVPILDVYQSKNLPGGAGNVAVNLRALGAEVIAVGRVGGDREGRLLKDLLEQEGVDTAGIFVEKEGITPLKNRFISDAQQLIRVDSERAAQLTDSMKEQVFAFIVDRASEIEVIAISDYGKGFLPKPFLQMVIDFANKEKIPTVVDPKGKDFSKYWGATLIKPNEKEAILASACSHDATLSRIAQSLFDQTHAEMVLITRSEKGLALFEKDQPPVEFPVKLREVKDVTGAGDTVLAVTTLLLASHLRLSQTLELANIAAGIAIERVGCASVSLSELAERLLEMNGLNKIFDENHLFVLKRALEGKKVTILGIQTEKGYFEIPFAQIQALSKKSSNERLVLYLMDSDPDNRYLEFLSSLGGVDFIVIGCESLARLIEKLGPDRAYTLNADRSAFFAIGCEING